MLNDGIVGLFGDFNMKRLTWLILGGGVAVVLVIWLIVEQLSGGVPVETARAKLDRIEEYVDERAKTRLPTTYLITMPYDGRIEPIKLAEGATVKRGDPVARIVGDDLDLALAEAAAGLKEADASILQNADASVEETSLKQVEKFAESMRPITDAAAQQTRAARESLSYANKELARIQRLHKSGAEPESHLQQAELEQVRNDVAYRQALLVYQAVNLLQVATDLLPQTVRDLIARKDLNAAVLQQQRARADVRRRQAGLNYGRGIMTSPVDGVVLARHVTNERALAAGTVLLEIGRPEESEIEADVLSLDVVNVRENAKVKIYGPAIGKTPVRGTVRRVYPAGFTKISSLGVEQQRVKVLIRFEPKDLKRLRQERQLGVGYRVRVGISTAEKAKALVVPRSALFRNTEGNWRLYAVEGGRARIRKIEVGLINDQSAEVTSGLSEGDQVVLAPESQLADGARVTPNEKGS